MIPSRLGPASSRGHGCGGFQLGTGRRSRRRRHQIAFSSRSELVRRSEIIDLYRSHIDARSTEFAPYERIKGFTLVDHELTLGDELTPTQKFKRKVIVTKHADVIEQMYRG